MFALPDLGVVDFVRNQPEVVGAAGGGDACESFARIDDAGGVVGGVDEQGFGATGVRFDVRLSGFKCVFRFGWYGDGYGPGGAQGAGVGGVVGIDVWRAVAGVANRAVGGEQRCLAAGRDQDVAAVVGTPVRAAMQSATVWRSEAVPGTMA